MKMSIQNTLLESVSSRYTFSLDFKILFPSNEKYIRFKNISRPLVFEEFYFLD